MEGFPSDVAFRLTRLEALGHRPAMGMVTVEQLRQHLDDYLAEVERGREVLIAQARVPIARLAPVGDPDWEGLSLAGLALAYGCEEPDYRSAALKETNPGYRA
jgi:antitoxin (DNA-binding transcriptional repressor) of toxin-antitoxin stability system